MIEKAENQISDVIRRKRAARALTAVELDDFVQNITENVLIIEKYQSSSLKLYRYD